MRKRPYPLSPALAEALADFGEGLRDLRRRRGLPMTYAADLALISRATLHKIERGDPSVSLGIYARVLQGYGLLGRLVTIVDGRYDPPGMTGERARLPRRIHLQTPTTSR
jgi:Predicted transcriptional regulator